MSKIEVNTVAPQCGTTLTLGESGDTVTLGSGASSSGFGASTLRVYCNVDQLTGIDTTTLGNPVHPIAGASGGGYGNYTWGVINVSRSVNTAKVFECYNGNGLSGIDTSAQVSRILGLKSILK